MDGGENKGVPGEKRGELVLMMVSKVGVEK